LPSLLLNFTPRSGNISSKKSIGLVSRLPEPLIVISLSLNATIGVNILMLSPDSPQSIAAPPPPNGGILRKPSLVIINSSPEFSTTAPNALMIPIAALSSLLCPGL
jgi:hypothetical protein